MTLKFSHTFLLRQIIVGTGCVCGCQLPMYTTNEYIILEYTQKLCTSLGSLGAAFLILTYALFWQVLLSLGPD